MANEQQLCDLSIAKAVNARRAGVTEPATPPWVFKLLLRLPGQISARYPYEALCMTGLRIVDDLMYTGDVSIETQWLLQRGWNVDMSIMLWRNFRVAFPQMRFEPETHRALPRTELVKEYGETFGNVIADVCVDPDSQPAINALLFNRFDRRIDRACTMGVVTTRVSQRHVRDELEHADLVNGLAFWDSTLFHVTDKPVTLAAADAARVYSEYTGGVLRTTFTLHPCEIDYAHPEEALR